MGLADEEARLREVYARRDAAGKPGLYAWHRPDVQYALYRRRSLAAGLLRARGLEDLSGLDVLDVGCGDGGWLRTLAGWGASPERLHGLDLLADRIARAKVMSPNIDFRAAAGWPSPFPDQSMDLVSALTVFSSILDPAARLSLAADMLRVARPGGTIMVYDFRVKRPDNRDVAAVSASEIRRLFPGRPCAFRSLTLAPPLARRLAPLSPALALAAETFFPFLRTHLWSLISV